MIMTLHEGSATSGAPKLDQQQQQQTSNSSSSSLQTSSTSNNNTPNSTSSSNTTHTTTTTHPNSTSTTTTTTSTTPTTTSTTEEQQHQQQQQNNEDSSKTTIKQFSDKSLEELAQYYLNLEPANIPDTGYVVSGIAGRFPNADNLNELWDNLLNGRDMVLGPDDKRWPLGE